MPKASARIENWRVQRYGGARFLVGHIVGHPRQDEFKMAYQATSPIVKMDLAAGWAETLNTIYDLGEPMDGQEKVERATADA